MFLLFWLQEKETKAVVIKSVWKSFNKYWDEQLKEQNEVKYSFNQFISGVVRPYRKEGYNDEIEESNPIAEMVKIVNRDYDIVEVLIVDNPCMFNGTSIKIAKESILTLKDFYTFNEIRNTPIFQAFSKERRCT